MYLIKSRPACGHCTRLEGVRPHNLLMSQDRGFVWYLGKWGEIGGHSTKRFEMVSLFRYRNSRLLAVAAFSEISLLSDLRVDIRIYIVSSFQVRFSESRLTSHSALSLMSDKCGLPTAMLKLKRCSA